MIIRVASKDDWRAISRISRRSGYEDYINNHWGASYLDDGMVLLAVDEEPAGFGRIDMLPDKAAWLSGLRVDPDHWRKGIGSLITRSQIEEARKMGAHSARMLVEEGNSRSRKLCEKLGFPEVGIYRYFSQKVDLHDYKETALSNVPYVSVRWRFVRPDQADELGGKFYTNGRNTVFMNKEENACFVVQASEKILPGGEGMTVWPEATFQKSLCSLQVMEDFPTAILYEVPIKTQ